MVKDGATLELHAITEFLTSKISAFKIPELITIVTESLPRNASGKILKRELRDQTIERIN